MHQHSQPNNVDVDRELELSQTTFIGLALVVAA